jgi:predicted signal transduction protein with EAL and GGDEF domain
MDTKSWWVVSIGRRLAPADARIPINFLRMPIWHYIAPRTGGRGTYRFFEPEMDARMQARRNLELDLRKAIVNGEFEVYYQPLVNLKTERNHRLRGAYTVEPSPARYCVAA